MKKITLLLGLFIAVFNLHGQQLSESAEISIFTYEPGPDIHAVFGHTAIRVKDDSTNTDILFNYGTFDFEAPNFVLKFIRGKLDYMLSAYGTEEALPYMEREDRDITEQVLNLTYSEKERLFEKLRINYLPQNRYYRYDFFFDNCATRVRDIVKEAVGKDILYDYPEEEEKTFRELIRPYIINYPWLHLGIDIAIGNPSDQKANYRQYMLLPDYIMRFYEGGKIRDNDNLRPLVSDKNLFFEGDFTMGKPSWITHPFLIFLIVFIYIVVSLFAKRNKQYPYLWLDRLLMLIIGFGGLFLAFLVLFTEHKVVAPNFMIGFFLPSHFIAAFFMKRIISSRWGKWYLYASVALALLPIITGALQIQYFNYYILPLVFGMMIRWIYLARLIPEK